MSGRPLTRAVASDAIDGARTTAAVVAYLVVVAALVFLTSHNVYNSLEILPRGDGTTVTDHVAYISEGSVRRQVGFVLFGLTGALGLVWFRSRRFTFNRPLFALATAFLAWSSLSLVWADEPLLTLRRLVVFWLLVVGAVGVVRATPRRLIPWFIGMSGVVFIFSGVGVEIALGTFRPVTEGYRFAGTLHPNAQGINCAMTALAGLWIATMRGFGRRRRLMGAGLLVVGTAFLVLTASRTAFAAALAAAAVLLVLQVRPGRRISLLAIGVNLLVLAGMLYANGAFGDPLRLLMLGRDTSDLATLNSRVPLWMLLSDYVEQRPVLGYGYSGFMTPEHALEVAVVLRFGIAAAHSVYLELILGVGAVGLTLFLVTVGFSLFDVVKRAEAGGAEAFLGSILVFELLNGVLDSSLMFPAWRFPTLLILAALCVASSPRHRLPIHSLRPEWRRR